MQRHWCVEHTTVGCLLVLLLYITNVFCFLDFKTLSFGQLYKLQKHCVKCQSEIRAVLSYTVHAFF